MTKEIPVHKDKLGRTINIGDFVAYPDHNSLEVGKVNKLNTKMIGVYPVVGQRWGNRNANKYPSDIIKLEASDMTWFVLKNAA